MRKADVLIVGGSMAGRTASYTARSHYEDAKISMIRPQKEEQVMIPCGLPYIFGTLGAAEKNVTPDSMLFRRNVDLIVDKASYIGGCPKTRQDFRFNSPVGTQMTLQSAYGA